MAPTQLSIVLVGLLNELGIADLSTLEAMLKHDTVRLELERKERKKTDNPREGWEDGAPPPDRDFKERSVVR